MKGASENAIYVSISRTRGSAPRDSGTTMRVTAAHTEGTIGGGALEFNAIKTARRLLETGQTERTETIALGPRLGQCCGGAVTLQFGMEPRPVDTPAPLPLTAPDGTAPDLLWVWGAGHVGRAVIACCPPGAFEITWIDSASDRFPETVPDHITALPAADMPRLARRAPLNARHLIFTYSHDIDLALCAALLGRGAAGIGLIGSDTKWARFAKRLRAMNLDPGAITCPIGDKTLGKAPDEIAHGTVRALLTTAKAKVSV